MSGPLPGEVLLSKLPSLSMTDPCHAVYQGKLAVAQAHAQVRFTTAMRLTLLGIQPCHCCGLPRRVSVPAQGKHCPIGPNCQRIYRPILPEIPGSLMQTKFSVHSPIIKTVLTYISGPTHP